MAISSVIAKKVGEGEIVKYIEFSSCNHGNWNQAFNYPDFMDCLFPPPKNEMF